MRRNGPLVILTAVADLGLAGCGSSAAPDAGDRPGNQAFVEYRPAGGEYAVTVTLGTRAAAPVAVLSAPVTAVTLATRRGGPALMSGA